MNSTKKQPAYAGCFLSKIAKIIIIFGNDLSLTWHRYQYLWHVTHLGVDVARRECVGFDKGTTRFDQLAHEG